jgi:hypothetical protein
MLPHRLRYTSGRLLQETFGSNTLDFFYDDSGNADALQYNGTPYYYIANLQGDVMSIVDAQGAVVASYAYALYSNLIGDNHTEIAIITGSF